MEIRENPKIGEIVGCSAFGPCTLEPHHPDLFYYGIHAVEILYAIMGEGCEQVSRIHAEGTDFVMGHWAGGRVGTLRGIRDGAKDYGAIVYGSAGIETVRGFTGYESLLEQVATFFQTGKSPVSDAETIELFAFMEAADESKRRGGAPVRLAEVLETARRQQKSE